MLFNSIAFILFLPAVYSLYWLGGRRYQNILLLLASYVFYGWWDWRFLGLIILSSSVDYWAGLGISAGYRRRAWLLLSLTVNLGALAIFKYLDFGIESFATLLNMLGFEAHLGTLGIILPVGISFYTFQTLSYTIDIYRRRIEPTRDPLSFFTFVAFFPQLVAGPIERAHSLLPQFLGNRRFDPTIAKDGCRQMIYGYLLKVVVADNLAPLVDSAYAAPNDAVGLGLLFATYAFAFQIYGDFAGYSHIAIGCARLFGISLSRNFAYPYFSRSPAEFWHRWHMSLSTWFRDYVYIPLGGSRVPPGRKFRNVLITFVLSGLWHGAGFNFIVWGFFHGLLVAAQWWDPRTRLEQPLGTGSIPQLKDILAVLVTFHLMCIGWVFFRADNLTAAIQIFAAIGTNLMQLNAAIPHNSNLLLIPIVVGIEWLQRGQCHALDIARFGRSTRWAIYLATVFVFAAFGAIETKPFIYFQF